MNAPYGPRELSNARASIDKLTISDSHLNALLTHLHPKDPRLVGVEDAFKEFLLLATQLTRRERSSFTHANLGVDLLWNEYSSSQEYKSWALAMFGRSGYPYVEGFATPTREDVVSFFNRNFSVISPIALTGEQELGPLFAGSKFAAVVRKAAASHSRQEQHKEMMAARAAERRAERAAQAEKQKVARLERELEASKASRDACTSTRFVFLAI